MLVIVTPSAEADIDDIGASISRTSERQANRVVDKILERIERIAILPHAGAPRPQWGEGIRIAVQFKYLIIYRVGDDAAHVLRVLHGSRDFDAILADDPLPE